MERWLARLDELGVTGCPVKHRTDGKLFKRSFQGSELYLTDGEFADDTVLLAETHKVPR